MADVSVCVHVPSVRVLLVMEEDAVAGGIHHDIEVAHFRQIRRMFHQVQGRSLLLLHLFRIAYPNI